MSTLLAGAGVFFLIFAFIEIGLRIRLRGTLRGLEDCRPKINQEEGSNHEDLQ